MKALILAFIAAGAFAIGKFYPDPDPKAKEELILYAVSNFLEQVHFLPVELNDEFSENAFNYYLDMLDNSKRFMLKSDIEQLEKFKYNIDEQYKDKSLEFFDVSVGVINSAITRGQSIYNEVITTDFDFEIEESISVDNDEKEFASSEDELREGWRKMLKYEILLRYEEKLEKLEKEYEEDGASKKDMDLLKLESEKIKLQEEAQEETKETFDDWFKRLSKVRRSDRFESYLNTLTHMFDPHSDYYNPKEKEDFNINMGGKLQGIGARLQTDGDYTKVVDIIVGGPAWKGKKLEVDDLITAVQQKGEEDILDITGMRVDDVVQHIRGTPGTVVLLTVKKKDGSKAVIEIERDNVIIEEGNAKSVLIERENSTHKVGYIRLPKFYADFESSDGRSCAADIAAELEKLKDENVDGIVLDLRNNGGGSLRDVVQMSGLFIDEGPIVQVKPRGRAPYVLEDEDPETQFDGHVIVMVNGYSASASEILAAALQDYERAVIVGSNSSFGKGTVQRFYDLDRAVRGNGDLKPLGQVKLTTQKFYRINGGSTQLKGVTPDIILPDNFHFMKTGEKQYDYALEWTEIDPVEFEKPDYVMPSLNELKERSSKRVAENSEFQLVLENAQRLKNNRDDKEYSLNLNTFKEDMDKREEEAEKFKKLWDTPIPGMAYKNLDIDKPFIEADSSRIARNDAWITDLTKDIYIEEVLNILSDMIEQSPSIGAIEKKK